MSKEEVFKIIDEVMNNREIDSIRNAILAIRDKVKDFPDKNDDWTKDYCARLRLRGNNELNPSNEWFEGAEYVVIDTLAKVDTGIYGIYWYE